MVDTDAQRNARAKLQELGQRRKNLNAARQAVKHALVAQREAARMEPDAIRAALAAGVKQIDIALDLGLSREHVRRLMAEGL